MSHIGSCTTGHQFCLDFCSENPNPICSESPGFQAEGLGDHSPGRRGFATTPWVR